jgi:hypothetical protein
MPAIVIRVLFMILLHDFHGCLHDPPPVHHQTAVGMMHGLRARTRPRRPPHARSRAGLRAGPVGGAAPGCVRERAGDGRRL